MRSTPRNRRLMSDLNVLRRLQDDSSILRFRPHGHPPDAYDIHFAGVGLMRDGQSVQPIRQHHVEIRLGANYPRVMPELRWKTLLFHPNISASGAVCLGGYQTHWVPSLDLGELCEMLWDMIRYANYDVTSPYNREAALWARSQRQYPFPVDDRPLRDLVAARPRAAQRAGSGDDIIMAEVVVQSTTAYRRSQPGDADVLFID